MGLHLLGWCWNLSDPSLTGCTPKLPFSSRGVPTCSCTFHFLEEIWKNWFFLHSRPEASSALYCPAEGNGRGRLHSWTGWWEEGSSQSSPRVVGHCFASVPRFLELLLHPCADLHPYVLSQLNHPPPRSLRPCSPRLLFLPAEPAVVQLLICWGLQSCWEVNAAAPGLCHWSSQDPRGQPPNPVMVSKGAGEMKKHPCPLGEFPLLSVPAVVIQF